MKVSVTDMIKLHDIIATLMLKIFLTAHSILLLKFTILRFPLLQVIPIPLCPAEYGTRFSELNIDTHVNAREVHMSKLSPISTADSEECFLSHDTQMPHVPFSAIHL